MIRIQKIKLVFSIIMISIIKVSAQSVKDYPFVPVPFTKVSINDEFWGPRILTNRRVTIPDTFEKSEETGRIKNFAIAGGLEEGEHEGIYFNDSDVFKIIEGAGYSLNVNPDPKLKEYVDGVIAKIAAAQEEDGYLYTQRTINPSKVQQGAGEKRWDHMIHNHELYNVGHMYEAAVAYYLATGEKNLLDVAIKNANLIDSVFGPNKNLGVPGHEEIEIGLVKLFRLTGDNKYLDLAKFFIDQRGNSDGHELYGKYSQDHKPFVEQRNAVGHSVRAGYLYAGVTDVAAITGSNQYNNSLFSIWSDIVEHKTYLTGGIGSEPHIEGFGPDYQLPNATAYTETCAAISMMLWNHRLFLLTGDVKYMDVFERTLYNGFLPGISLEGDTYFYPNPLESDGIYEFNQGMIKRSPWFDVSCCPVNIVRILPSLSGYIYSIKDQDIFINLFIGNTAELDLNGKKIKLNQSTKYPWNGKVKFSVEEADNDLFAGFKIRIPGWVRNEVLPGDLYSYLNKKDSDISLLINGENQQVDTENGYIILDKNYWKSGDIIEVSFEMEVRKVISNEKVIANKGKIAFERGPLVYCAEQVDNPNGVLNLKLEVNSQFKYLYDEELLGGMGKIIGKATDEKNRSVDFMAIPYYGWAHRDDGEMSVWLNSK
tara:strand:- start:1844 stop:3799 length:1956 start_codon:yes stop_codon:yes gene_type:complete